MTAGIGAIRTPPADPERDGYSSALESFAWRAFGADGAPSKGLVYAQQRSLKRLET